MSEFKPEQRPSKVEELLLKLQEDSRLLEEFNNDPDKIMNKAGIISSKDIDILKSKDLLSVRRLLTEGKSKQIE